MDEAGRAYVAGLSRCLEGLEDPRVVGRCDHLLFDIVAITLLAVMCGAEDWPDIEQFGESREDFLKTFLELPNGIPSHDTFRRVFGKLERGQFAACLFAWTQALHEATGGKVISIDGKSLRRTFSKKGGLKMLHLVTAWATENHLTLGQVACEEKSNEITAIPELLKLLSLRGSTVTIDAMGCQKEIAAQIREQKGHYVLQAKGNQPKLEEQLVNYFGDCMEADFEGVEHERHETTETGHGRTETRIVDAVSLPKDFAPREEWKDLHTLVVVTSQRVVEGKESWESRYYITDHRPRAKPLGDAIRRHWGIENGQHWILDVTFGEDSRRQQDRNGSANLAAIRRLAVSLLRQEKANKRGVKNKRLQCALDPRYLLKVLANAKF
jgi:predicted transposase YbfD/YdcC